MTGSRFHPAVHKMAVSGSRLGGSRHWKERMEQEKEGGREEQKYSGINLCGASLHNWELYVGLI